MNFSYKKKFDGFFLEKTSKQIWRNFKQKNNIDVVKLDQFAERYSPGMVEL